MSKNDFDRWQKDGYEFGWTMPYAAAWKRLPVIRHIRAISAKIQIERWYSFGPGSIGLRSGYDDWIVYGIWSGQERSQP